ncbi:L-methionine gamma-lyase [Frankia canadensis]|uniref:L-methionine gamma-lyase n=1 Tax=Frankia canadensis TaxID=1836972 RepID=A0A2I2KUX7_9ACTN|nr:bifunctional o-acetylhomoserine/o-acetylserine sulfhydrylase [Frankia canadensis]SNQ49461.1 L-methionine gamma-lyase [Frankia canadensis]SOU56751.1 L-methionine gamma-lyase [Frankia canadensis]
MTAPQTGWSFETRQVHAGAAPDPATGARAVPIYQTTSFVFDDTQHAADLFSLAEVGFTYTRVVNPTQDALERRVADLEGAVGALATASGQAAITLALLNLGGAGSHIVSSTSLYGGTYALLRHTLAELGVQTTFVDDADDLDAWRAAIRPTTVALYGETIGNPRGNVLDTAGIARVGHDAGVPLIVDNTLASPFLNRPLEHGADIVVHSATKFIGGHGTSIGGIIVDGGRFDWSAGRHPRLVTPDPAYHGVVFQEEFGEAAYIVRARARLLRDLGPALSPTNAFLLLQGLETLSLRMERHSANADRVATWLAAHPQVGWVAYPGLASSPWHAAARHYLPRGAGAVLAFGIDGGAAAGRAFIEGLELHSHLANVGDVRSLAIHPASTTHAQLTAAEQADSGVSADLVRLSVGIEGIDDILADLDRGFRAAKAA